MEIERIFVAGYRRDVRFTRCCITSIRRWYPLIPITLIKDEIAGPYDTSDLERYFHVEIFQTTVRRFGWGMGKLEPLFLRSQERCLILDSDVMFMGPILARVEQHEEDFVVAYESHRLEEIHSYYFDERVVQRLYPSFQFPGYVFNSGQLVTTTGIFQRGDFAQFVSFDEPRQPLLPRVFFCGEQGFLNFVLLSKVQEGKITLKREHFMTWAGGMQRNEVDTTKLGADSPYDFMVHWAGPKRKVFSTPPMRHLLQHFENEYYRVVGRSGLRGHLHKTRISATNLWKRVRASSN